MLNKKTYAEDFIVRAWAICAVLLMSAHASAQCECGNGASGGYSLAMGMPGVPMGASLGQSIEANAIYLNVNVPEKALLKVNGDPTISLGTTRYFVIKDLDPQHEYKFVIVAETANAAGVPMEETKTVKLKVGAIETVTLKPVKRKVLAPTVIVDDAAAEEASSENSRDTTQADVSASRNSRYESVRRS